MRLRKIIVMLISMIIFAEPMMMYAKGVGLTEGQKKVADKVAELTADGWNEYGVLPSVAVTQAFIESSLGVNQVRPNNLWGTRPGGEYSSHKTLKDGLYFYLGDVLNNGLYDNVLYEKDYKVQLRKILMGGYYGEDDGGTIKEYYQDCIDSIKKYGFDKYDKVLFEKIRREKERKRKKKWKKTYILVYDKDIPDHAVSVDKGIIKRGVILIWDSNETKGIYDVVGGQKGRKIGITDPSMDGMKVKIEVYENAKG